MAANYVTRELGPLDYRGAWPAECVLADILGCSRHGLDDGTNRVDARNTNP
jgi:hypothetical protein